MKNSLSVILATLLVGVLAQASELKIGFVDVRKAIETTKAGQKVKKDLEADFKKREKDLQKRADDVKKMNQDYEKKSLVLADEAKAKKQSELQEEMMKYNQEVRKNTADLRKKEQELMEPIFKKMQEVINNVAKADKYSIILQNRENVLFVTQEIDLTERVVKEFEKK